ncbi:hypothetical protein KC887_00595 [Candidatus Kaiserbacteria bacterium]|nr:hypothetical protein [Candidatus Kaiserbacteria bacterium]
MTTIKLNNEEAQLEKAIEYFKKNLREYANFDFTRMQIRVSSLVSINENREPSKREVEDYWAAAKCASGNKAFYREVKRVNFIEMNEYALLNAALDFMYNGKIWE